MPVAALPVLTVVTPLAAAAVLAAGGFFLRRRAVEAAAIVTAAAVSAACALLLVKSGRGLIVYWLGGWGVHGGLALGISFVVDPAGAAMATLSAVLVLASFIFSVRYFEAVGSLFHVLMLIFLGAMCGFSFTGDAFNLFVFFELMSVAAFALCGYKTETEAPVQGALNFAVTNTIGAFLVLSGIALLYGRTGALNLAQMGQALGTRADGLAIVAFTLLCSGFLVKAAVAPFHFWLADAHAVAPTPVCVLFSGIMVEMALYAVARVYWVVFSAAFAPHAAALRGVLTGLGVLTCLVGGTMCYAQRHVKRMLAFSTVSHVGVMLLGLGMLTPLGLAGAALDVMGHAMVKSALFFCSGIVLHRLGSVDEVDLRSRGLRLRGTGVAFALGGLALAGLPPFGIFAGDSLIEAAGRPLGLSWPKWVVIASAVLTGAAVLRFTGRVFWGWGYFQKEAIRGAKLEEEQETERSHSRTPRVMIGPAAVFLALAVAIGVAPPLRNAVLAAATAFQDRAGYIAAVLSGAPFSPLPSTANAPPLSGSVFEALFAVTLAVLAVVMTLFRERIFKRPVAGGWLVQSGVKRLQQLHSGHVSDYVTWTVVGVSAIGGLLILLIR